MRPSSIVKGVVINARQFFHMTSSDHLDLIFIFLLVSLASGFKRRQYVLGFLCSFLEVIMRRIVGGVCHLGTQGQERQRGIGVIAHVNKTKNRYEMCKRKGKKREFGECEASPLHNFNKNFI